jgi:SAM-dependent methyltransferase
MDKSIFNKYSDYYDLLYNDKNYSAEANYVHKLVIRHSSNSKNILEFGSGTGRHGCILAGLGYKVHGIELSEEMCMKSKLAPGFTCQQGDIANIKMNKTYDVVLSLFHVMSYQISNKKITDVFSNAAYHLNKGGLFIFDFWYSPAVYTLKPSVKIKRMSNKKIEIVRIAEPEIYSQENRVDVNYSIFLKDLVDKNISTLEETHPMRHFSLLEIDHYCEANGFKRIDQEEFMTGAKIKDNTWGPCVVLKKI